MPQWQFTPKHSHIIVESNSYYECPKHEGGFTKIVSLFSDSNHWKDNLLLQAFDYSETPSQMISGWVNPDLGAPTLHNPDLATAQSTAEWGPRSDESVLHCYKTVAYRKKIQLPTMLSELLDACLFCMRWQGSLPLCILVSEAHLLTFTARWDKPSFR